MHYGSKSNLPTEIWGKKVLDGNNLIGIYYGTKFPLINYGMQIGLQHVKKI